MTKTTSPSEPEEMWIQASVGSAVAEMEKLGTSWAR